jgi:hypothetical protein
MHKRVIGQILEFYENSEHGGSYGKLIVDDNRFRGINGIEFCFFPEHLIKGTKIPIGNHKDRYKIGEKTFVTFDALHSDAGMHPTLETVYWAHNIKLRKIKDVLDPDWINR